MSPRCLIINADDFGFTPGITEGTSELMCHASRVDDDLLSDEDTYIYQREQELETLLDPRVHETIQSIGIELVDFSAVQNR